MDIGSVAKVASVKWSHSSAIVLAVGLALIALLAPVAHAGDFPVTKTSDTNDGACDSDCSLREAVIAANASPGHDTVIMPAGTYTLTLTGTNEDASATGDLDITSDLNILGAGVNQTIIDGGRLDRVLHVTGTVTVDISNVTVTNGQSEFAEPGGGIYNVGGALTLGDSAVLGNLGQGEGGGIYNAETSAITLTNCLVGGNYAFFSNAGILNLGVAVLISDTVSGNGTAGGCGGVCNPSGVLTMISTTIALNDGNLGSGGVLNGGIMTITNSAVISNTSGGNGGGIYSGAGSVDLNNVTISANTAQASGGGIYRSGGVMSINNATVVNNTADSDEDGTGSGGGISGSVDLSNSVVSGNLGEDSPNCTRINSMGHNLIGTMIGCTLTGDPTGIAIASAAGLGPLQDNGGPTLTHAPLPGSLAVDRGSPGTPGEGSYSCESTDQRGVARPQGIRCDMGAYEVQPHQFLESRVYLPTVLRDYAGCAPLLSDDFGDPGSGWPTGNNPVVTYQYLDGEYRALVKSPLSSVWVPSPLAAPADYVVEVTMRFASTVGGNGGLIVDAVDAGHHYYFALTNDGNYSLRRYSVATAVLIDWTAAPAFNPYPQANRIRLVRDGSVIKLYLNGKFLAMTADSSYYGGARVGVRAATTGTPNVDVRFDDFEVRPSGCQ